ncbi:hypothetical protein ASF58_23345 [Methylobacterium sp. Leaf125]|uniref:hypothetical protein n=1 Tax=Methylobacterium sp. Leaf125 TaxID=1736265 RepID=UPI0006FD1496|nr:hypothetical protein [Methylobacterium sp. Leaf125]KQQ39079.1 hypothetical protein ASF58_23345 [Methylobacterium sp. Leaf125]
MTAAQQSAPAPDPFDWYVAALEGNPPPIDPTVAPCGYWRLPNRENGFDPLAIWIDDAGQKWAQRGAEKLTHVSVPGEVVFGDLTVGGEEGFSREVMAYAIRYPVDVDLFFEVLEGRTRWPDLPPPIPVTYSNAPSDPLQAAKQELEAERIEVERFLRTPVADQVRADLAANWANRLADLEKRIEDKRVELKAPHDKAAKAVQAVWKPLVDKAAVLKSQLKASTTKFLQDKAREEAIARAKLAEAGEVLPTAAPGPRAGTAGRTVSVATLYRAQIEDYPATLAFFAEREEVRELVQSLANRIIAAKGTVPGCKAVPVQAAR